MIEFIVGLLIGFAIAAIVALLWDACRPRPETSPAPDPESGIVSKTPLTYDPYSR